MTQKLIIIRGNSGSGKSTIAKRLQAEMGQGTMLIPQDIIRREILKTPDVPNNDVVELIYELAMYGQTKGHNVIIEGILSKNKYGEMLGKLIDGFNGNAKIFYLDISFEETLRRHATKPALKAKEFGEKEMRQWWKDKDYLGVKGETILPESLSEDDLVQTALASSGKRLEVQ